MLSKKIKVLIISVLMLCTSLMAGGDCNKTATGKVPLNDLGAGFYQGFVGGLFPGGLNTPPAPHDSAGRALALAIQPLDANGQIDVVNGDIVLVTIGMSNTSRESDVFIPLANSDPVKNPKVKIVNGALGGHDAKMAADINNDYWQFVQDQIAAAGFTNAQVQAAWVKQATGGPKDPFPAEAVELQGYLEQIARNLKFYFPNLKIAYYSSRIYAGYATSNLNPEPHAYESGFSVKWMIDKQINGDPNLNYDPAKGPVVAPYLTWGAYLWADGLTPRSDGLIWECADLQDDGTHPSESGKAKVAELLLNFFRTNPAAAPWYLNNGTVPVELINFEAGIQNFDVVLRWATASETNNLGFDIERKSGHAPFQKIAFVPGNGSTSAQSFYEYRDSALPPGFYSYRLKQIDTNGDVSFSSDVTVQINAPQGFSLEPNYPNPFRHSTTFVFKLAEPSFVSLRIYNLLGQEVARLVSQDLDAGLHQVRWEVNHQPKNLTPGIYFVILRHRGPDGMERPIGKRKLLFLD